MGTSPWAADKGAAEACDRLRPAEERGSRRGIRTKLRSRILSAAEAVQAASAAPRVAPGAASDHARCRGPEHWHDLDSDAQVSPTEILRNAQWRMATALRLGATPGRVPRSTCALRKGNDGVMCEQSLAKHPFHSFLLLVWRSQGQTAPSSPVHAAQAHGASRGLCGHGGER